VVAALRHKTLVFNNLRRTTEGLRAGAPLAAPVDAMTRKILIVEDEEPIHFALREYFSAVGYEVTAAREWEEAEALLATRRFDIVLTDLRLTGFGGAEGLEIIGFVRANCPDTRIILLTGYGSADVQMEAHRRGVDAMLFKPTPLVEVARTADQVMRLAS